MSTLDRHVIGEVLRPLLVVLGLLTLLFAGYTTAEHLVVAAAGQIGSETVTELVALKCLIALEVLIPIALFVSVVMAIGRLQRDGELAAMGAVGYGEPRLTAALLGLFLVLAAIVALLSLYGRPWAYQRTYDLRAEAEAAFDLSDLEARRFYGSSDGDRVFFVEGMDRRKQRMQGFFGWVDDGKTPTIVCARSAERTPKEVADGVSLTLREVRVYHFGRGGEVTSVSAGSLFYDLTSEVLRSTGYKRKAASTPELLESGTTKDMAEFQWRLSRGLSTGLLGLLAIRLGWGRRRRDRYGRLILAIACYVAYYLLSLAARAWVEGGRVPFVPGLWWVDIGLGVLLLAPRMGRRRRSS